MTKFYKTVLDKKVFLRLKHDKGLHELADLIEKRDPPPKLLADLGVRKVTPQK